MFQAASNEWLQHIITVVTIMVFVVFVCTFDILAFTSDTRDELAFFLYHMCF